MKFTNFCNYCGKEYIPKRRGVQQFCSNSCRSRNWQVKQKRNKLTTTKENSVIPEIVKPSENNKITTAGIANAALGFGAATLTQHLFTPKHQKNATKEDIQKLSSLIKGQRYFLVNNLPIDQFRRKPFYDIETGNVIYL